MRVIGLTGSIGMGKSTAARAFRLLRAPVFDADAVVHELTRPGGAAIPALAAALPAVVRDGTIDRQQLGAQAFAQPQLLKKLEAVLHPMVAQRRDAFLQACARRRAPTVVLDIPLLFESGMDENCDLTAVVIAPPFLQAARVLSRPGMTAGKFAAIRAGQMPDAEKAARADIVIRSGLDKRRILTQVRRVLRMVA